MKVFILAAALIGSAWARCNNDCSGNGICNAGSVCECELNFLGNDCSKRLCLFGKAFIDSPLGDINANGQIDTDQQIQYQYANGLVGEQYDNAYGLGRTDNTKAWNEAHFYRECSNKGSCDRSTGQCACFPGFKGEGCRRISCPNDCSNKGQCVNMYVSNADFKAWDQKKTVECQCDPGYTGADCSLRKCPQGTDPISTVYTNSDSVYRIQWGQKTGKWSDAGIELPNGPVLWTISYQDDYGDVWTTSAVTTYYQARQTADGSLIVGPQVAGDIVTTPFFMNPDYRGSNQEVINVDGGVKAAAKSVDFVYTEKNSNNRVKFSFDESFIGEQVNASIQALPNDVVRQSYVHTVFNYGLDQDKVFIYPSMGVPLFSTKVGDTGTLAAGTPGTPATVIYATGAGACSPDTPSATDCGNVGNFADGKSISVNDQRFRFPYWVTDADATAGKDAVAKAYTNCDKNALCIFITIPEPVGTKKMNVNYKYKTLLRAMAAADTNMKPEDYTTSWAREKSNVNGAGNLVTVEEVGSNRKWHKLIDGTPIIEFESTSPLYDCSRRGLCDWETGQCKCFDGYSGYKCQERSVLGY